MHRQIERKTYQNHKALVVSIIVNVNSLTGFTKLAVNRGIITSVKHMLHLSYKPLNQARITSVTEWLDRSYKTCHKLQHYNICANNQLMAHYICTN